MPDTLLVDAIGADPAQNGGSSSPFTMWSLLHMLGSVPNLDVTFNDPRDREAARMFMDLRDQANAG
jgi:hypothetical protein